MKLRKTMSRIACLFVAVVMMVAMSTTTADAASFSKAAPKGVKATCASGVSVKVTCKKKKGATGYYFYYATKKKGKYKFGTKSTSRTATVKGLTPGKTYYFKVKAYKGKVLKKFSKMSKPAKCKVVLKKPGIAYKDRCCCRIAVKLSGSAGAKGYKIYRSTNKYSGYVKVGTTSANSWLDEGKSGAGVLKPSTTYYYKVRAYYNSYHSPYSAAIPIRTLPRIDGNATKYDPNTSQSLVPLDSDCAKLKNRKILFLGSSITKGSASDNCSFVDYIGIRNGTSVKKLAQSSTNLAKKTITDASYVNRLWNDNPSSFIPDIFACQLSLNDSLNGIKTGSLPTIKFDELDEDKLRTLYGKANTVSDAIGFITAYAYYYWPDCQVVFYTVRNNGYNDSYKEMRSTLYAAQDKYGKNQYGKNRIEIIDMWSVKDLTTVKSDLRTFCLYMDDNNHPKRAGYLHQWTKKFEKAFINWMPEEPDYYTVIWKNADGTVLETDSNARKGEIPSYGSKKPEKADDEDYTYKFIGWKDEANPDQQEPYTTADLNNHKVTEDVTYIAVFEPVPKQVKPEPPTPADPGANDPSDQNQQDQPADSEGNGSSNDGASNGDASNGGAVNDGSNEGGSSNDGAGEDGSNGGESNGGSDGDSNSVLDKLGITGIVESLLRAA